MINCNQYSFTGRQVGSPLNAVSLRKNHAYCKFILKIMAVFEELGNQPFIDDAI